MINRFVLGVAAGALLLGASFASQAADEQAPRVLTQQEHVELMQKQQQAHFERMRAYQENYWKEYRAAAEKVARLSPHRFGGYGYGYADRLNRTPEQARELAEARREIHELQSDRMRGFWGRPSLRHMRQYRETARDDFMGQGEARDQAMREAQDARFAAHEADSKSWREWHENRTTFMNPWQAQQRKFMRDRAERMRAFHQGRRFPVAPVAPEAAPAEPAESNS